MSTQVIYTIGHSRHAEDEFIRLLRQHEIKTLADVRSRPYSRFCPQFNKQRLTDALAQAGIAYEFLGRKLGGRPEDARYYDPPGRVRYDLLAQSPEFHQGLQALLALGERGPTAIMCAEEDPARCHRRLLVGRELLIAGIELRHIRGDGHLAIETAERPLCEGEPEESPRQRKLFDV